MGNNPANRVDPDGMQVVGNPQYLVELKEMQAQIRKQRSMDFSNQYPTLNGGNIDASTSYWSGAFMATSGGGGGGTAGAIARVGFAVGSSGQILGTSDDDKGIYSDSFHQNGNWSLTVGGQDLTYRCGEWGHWEQTNTPFGRTQWTAYNKSFILVLSSIKATNTWVSANIGEEDSWDLNRDGKFQKNEADGRWLSGGGVVSVDNAKINWSGLKIPEGAAVGSTFAISTTDAFLTLPYETAATYGGTTFIVLGPSQVMVVDQLYHYQYRPNNSAENVARNIMNWYGMPEGQGTDFMIHYNNPLILIK